jgi:TolA-binding protein
MPPKLPDSMPWQIYQAYLGGPSALLRLFEAAFGRHGPVRAARRDQQQQQIDDLSAHIGQLKSQIERLQAEVSELRGRNFQLGRRNAELEALITKDSHNSARPPSTTRRGTSGRRVCGGLRENDPADRRGIAQRPCGSWLARTASSSIDRMSAGAATPR